MFILAALLLLCVASSGLRISLLTRRRSALSPRTSTRLSALSISQVSSALEKEVESKPVLLYLPGLDGSGDYSLPTFRNLSNEYSVARLQITPDDRSSFLQVSEFILSALAKEPFQGRNVTLVGESCGALFAAHVALRAAAPSSKTSPVQRLVLVNPATSFDKTSWSLTGRAVAATGPAFPIVGLATLLTTAIEAKQIASVGQQIAARVTSVETAVAEMNSLMRAGSEVTRILPADTLGWRLAQFLEQGNSLLRPRLGDLNTPTLVLVGKNDRLLPSASEGRRLAKALPRAEFKEFEAGHALLDGSALDLGKEMRLARVFSPTRWAYTGRRPASASSADTSYLDFPVPTDEEMEAFEEEGSFYNNLIKPFSPVFFSTSPDGAVQRGLGAVPVGGEGRPVLLIGNHQIFGADLGIILREFIRERRTLPRGLAHPMTFSPSPSESEQGSGRGRGQGQGQGQGLASNGGLFLRFGAVEVSPMSLYDLLSRNETVLLFPGGVKEAFHGRNESYAVNWPKNDFVRMAALHRAIIVPFGAVGMADSVNMLLSPDELEALPVLGNWAKENQRSVPQARAGGNERMTAPILAPSLPQRNYFLFGKPLDTAELCPDVSDRAACKAVYEQAKGGVEGCIAKLLRFRESDAFKEAVPRTVYEVVHQGQQAPTGDPSLLY